MGKDLEWLGPCAAIVAVEFLLAPLAGPFSEVKLAAYLLIGVTLASVILAGGSLLSVRALWTAGVAHPLRQLPRTLPWPAAAAAFLVCMQIAALNLTKHMLPIRVGFFADPYLAAFDHALFGQDPWRITHAWLGWASPFLDRAYALWAPIKAVTIAALVFLPASPTKTRGIIAYFLCFSLGCATQYLGASAGPIFYEHFGFGSRYADLPIEPWVDTTRAYLLSDIDLGTKALGGGISAMPSLHVALAVWVALTWHRLSVYLRPFGWAFATLVTIGSVHLGWHYAADGMAGIAIAVFSWIAAPSLVRIFIRVSPSRLGTQPILISD